MSRGERGQQNGECDASMPVRAFVVARARATREGTEDERATSKRTRRSVAPAPTLTWRSEQRAYWRETRASPFATRLMPCLLYLQAR